MQRTASLRDNKTQFNSQVLVGNKCDMDEGKRAVPYSRGQALADEFGIRFFETSAKNNVNVDEVFTSSLLYTYEILITFNRYIHDAYYDACFYLFFLM